MTPGVIEGAQGLRCEYTRTEIKRETIWMDIKELMKKGAGRFTNMLRLKGVEKVKVGMNESAKTFRQDGVIEKENKRTVWIRFGVNGLTKVKKRRVELL